MPRTKSVTNTSQAVMFDRNQLISKLNAIGIEEKITKLLESHEILEYYEEKLVRTVQKNSDAFRTEKFRKQYDKVVSRDNLMLNLRTNIETNLLSNALAFWFRIDRSIDEIMQHMLNELFVKRVIELLAIEFADLAYELLDQEDDFCTVNPKVDSDMTEFPQANPFFVATSKKPDV